MQNEIFFDKIREKNDINKGCCKERVSLAKIFLNFFSGTGFRNYVRNDAVLVSANGDLNKTTSADCFYEMELAGFYSQANVLKIFEFLNARTCSPFVDFLDGRWITKSNLAFRIYCKKDEFSDLAHVQQFVIDGFRPASGIFRFSKMFEGTYPMEARLEEQSVKVTPVESSSGSDYVTYLVNFKADFRLLSSVEGLSLDEMLKPQLLLVNKDMYPMFKTLNKFAGQFNLIDQKFIRLKSRNQREAEYAYLWDFVYGSGSMSISKYVEFLQPILGKTEWASRLDFWVHPEKYGFTKKSSSDWGCSDSFNYEVPNKTCSNTVQMFIVDTVLQSGIENSLKKLCESIQDKTMELINTRRSVSYHRNSMFFSSVIRDVRTIQSLQEHCFYLYSAVSSLIDFGQEFVWSKDYSLIRFLGTKLLEKIKYDPVEFMDHEFLPVKRMASALICGNLYGE